MERTITADAVPQAKTRTMTNFRWKIAFLIFLISFVAYMDRVNLSVATPVIMQEFGFDKMESNWLQYNQSMPEYQLAFDSVTTCFTLTTVDERGVAKQVTPQVTLQVTPQVDYLMKCLSSNTSFKRDVLQAAVGLKDRENFRLNYLKPALELGLIEMTLPHKPNSKLQRYHLTEKGVEWKKKYKTKPFNSCIKIILNAYLILQLP